MSDDEFDTGFDDFGGDFGDVDDEGFDDENPGGGNYTLGGDDDLDEEVFELTTNFADRERYGGASRSSARTAQSRAVERFRATLDAAPFDGVDDTTRGEAMSLAAEIPEIETRNPKLLVGAILWTISKDRRSEKSESLSKKFATFAEKYNFSDAERIDLVRYVRIVSRKPFLFSEASKSLLEEISS